MALRYKNAIIHDGACRCCMYDGVTLDAARIKQDPTGTGQIRRAMRADLAMKWRSMRVLLKAMLVDNDLLGLGSMAMLSAMHLAAQLGPGADKVRTFQTWFDTSLKLRVLEGSGDFLHKYIERGYMKGVSFAENNTGIQTVRSYAMQSTVDTIAALTVVELQGVIEATSQQAVRAVTNGILAKQNPRMILRNVLKVIDSIGVTRSNTIAEFVIVKAFGDATLDVYEAVGVTEVGLIPEVLPPRKSLGDVARSARSRKQGAGSRTTKERVPSLRTVQRIRAQEKVVERLKRVNVRTAGDDDVCPVCEGIAEDGPYPINTARTLIPAHPNCRCAFVPVRDRRFAGTDQ